MRLWHKELITVLPDKQLGGQWSEISAIAGSIIKHEDVNHRLVKKVMNYDGGHFIRFTSLVMAERLKRGLKADQRIYVKVRKAAEIINKNLYNDENPNIGIIPEEVLYSNWHNVRYLVQCYYNLEEKYDCGMITKEEWCKVNNFIISFITDPLLD